jgi:hypothetical protein
MAGSSEGEELDYWPGFVDALTTMVMVLTFVMMVLGIVVFTLSQNVSKNYMAAIATAVNVDANAAKQNLTPDQVKAEILEAIKELRERAGQPPPPPPPTPAPSPKQEETEVALLQSIQEKEKALAQLKDAKTELQKVQQQMQDIKKEIEEARNTPIVVDDTVVQKTETPAPEKRIVASTDSSATPASAGAKSTASEKALSITFKDRAVLLDDDTRKEIESFAQRTKAGRFIVRGNAGGTTVSITELRRTAYYRVMVVRKQLIESGIPADRVTVFVDDVADSSRNNDVSVSSTN